MKRGLLLLLLSLVSTALIAQTNQYQVSFPNAEHHEARISYTLDELGNQPVTLWMSRTSPGRYALHEFAKNVYEVTITDAQGDTLDFTRPNPYSWNVANHGGNLTFNYTLFGDHADGTYTGIDETHAHMNMPATFVWAEGDKLEQRPIEIKFEVPEGSDWKVATQLKPTDDPYTYTAPNRDYFLDSPTELSNYWMSTWTVPGPEGAGEQIIRMALHHQGTEQQAQDYVEMGKKVVDELIAVFGEAPKFDYGTYTFLTDYLPWVYGDGMEHRNSTILTSTRPLETHALGNLGTFAHEFIHAWNIERIRPDDLEPFDFTHVNMTDALWYGEGFTSYYDDLSIRRAGLIDDAEYAQRLSGTLNYVLNYPGSQFFSAAEMSMQAPFVDAARSVDAQNKSNTFISYYSWGAMLGLGLDLKLRTDFDTTLDALMQAMWQQYGTTETPYTLDDLQAQLAQLTGDADFAQQWFDRFVYGHQMMDYKALLANAGFILRKANPDKAILLANTRLLQETEDGLYLDGNVFETDPLYTADLNRRDTITQIDGQSITTIEALNNRLADQQPGDTIALTYTSRGQTYTENVTLGADPSLELVPVEETDERLRRKERKFREGWLGSKFNK
ncbi:MAG: M61 family metallopeptidase [Bacteroidota bacterium]